MRLLEREFAAFCGAAHGCAVANGTDALQLALRAYGIGPGDEVVTVANTFIATGEAILLVGAQAGVRGRGRGDLHHGPGTARGARSRRARGWSCPVHLYGHPADMTAIGEVARRHGLPVLEDAAQAHGAAWQGRRAGALGHAAAASASTPARTSAPTATRGWSPPRDADFVARVRQIANHGAGTNKLRQRRARHQQPARHAAGGGAAGEAARTSSAWNEREAPSGRSAYARALAGAPGDRPAAREGGGALGVAPLHDPACRERDALPAHLQRARDRDRRSTTQGVGPAQ